MRPDHSPLNYVFVRAATIGCAGVSAVGGQLVVDRLPGDPRTRGLLLAGILVPVLFLAALFVYKTTIGIVNRSRGLIFWALWVQTALAPITLLFWSDRPQLFWPRALLLLVVMGSALVAAPGRVPDRGRVLRLPLAALAVGFLLQLALLQLYLPR